MVLSFVWALLGYRLSENDRRTLGRTPWGLPSAVWALFWFLSVVIGLVLYLIAHAGGTRRAHQHIEARPGTGLPGARPHTAAEAFPAYPRPANAWAPGVNDESDPAPDSHLPVPSAPAGPAPPPAWHPDPSGRFHYRWWNGTEWTAQVSTDGHPLIDTDPDQRIGPY